jgi:23S rRNA pseudouridine1911/1915/1917 synthase
VIGHPGIHLVHAGPDEVVAIKPAGLASEMPRDPDADSLVLRLRQQGVVEPRLVHRLDAPACGLVLVAGSRAAAAYYAAEIAARRWAKWYVARVTAAAPDAAGLIGSHKAYLKTEGRASRVVRAGGKPSFLEVVASAPAPGAPGLSDVLIRLQTGRHHQVRVMLAHAGAPLAGDRQYGGTPEARMYLEQVVLGAARFGTGEWAVWQAPAHADREPWAPSLHTAVEAAAATARTAPPPPGPAR